MPQNGNPKDFDPGFDTRAETLADGAAGANAGGTDPDPNAGFPESTAASPSVPPLRQFGRYELLLEMAEGGMATLYLARLRGPENFEKLVVLKRIRKVYSDEEKFTRMFLDEARISASIQHPNVATVFDLGEEQGHHFIAIEYVHGQNLAELLSASNRRDKVLDWFGAMRILANAAAGLHAAHELKDSNGEFLGVVHRDVSPHNILVGYDGTVKVVDFGIAYALGRLESTQSGNIKGKVAYMAPEQIESQDVDRRTDVFALGIVLYEAVLGRRLFRADNDAATIVRIMKGDIPRPRSIRHDLPVAIERIILRALAQRPADRFQTAADLEDALNQELMNQGKYVGQRQLSEVMDTLFHDRRQLKDEQIRVAIQRKQEQPMIAVGMNPKADISSSAISISSMIGQRPRTRLTAGIIGGAVALGIAILSLVLVLRGRGDESAGNSQTKPSSETRMDASTTLVAPLGRPDAGVHPPGRLIQLRIDIEPSWAKPAVVFRGRSYKGRRFRAAIPPTKREETLEIRAPGFEMERLVVRLNADFQTRVRLQRKRRARWTGRRLRKRPPPRRRRTAADFVKIPR